MYLYFRRVVVRYRVQIGAGEPVSFWSSSFDRLYMTQPKPLLRGKPKRCYGYPMKKTLAQVKIKSRSKTT